VTKIKKNVKTCLHLGR